MLSHFATFPPPLPPMSPPVLHTRHVLVRTHARGYLLYTRSAPSYRCARLRARVRSCVCMCVRVRVLVLWADFLHACDDGL